MTAQQRRRPLIRPPPWNVNVVGETRSQSCRPPEAAPPTSYSGGSGEDWYPIAWPGDIATGSCKSTSRRSACGPRGSRLRTHHRRQAHLGSILDRHRSPGPDGSGRAWRCAAAGAFRAPRRPWSDDHLKSDDAAGARCRSERRAGDRCLTPRPVCPVHTCPDSTSSASNVICRRCMHSRCWSADIGWLVSTELPAVAVPLRPDPVDHPRVRRRTERGGARARLRIHAPGLVAAGVSHRGRTVLAMPRPNGSSRRVAKMPWPRSTRPSPVA